MKNYWKKVTTLLTALTLVVVLGVCLSACGSSNNSIKELSMDEYQANLEAAKYEVKVCTAEKNASMIDMFLMGVDGLKADDVVWVVSAQNSNSVMDNVTIIEFKTDDAAKAYYDNAKAQIKAGGDAAKDFSAKQNGKIACFGHDDAIAAAQGK